MDHCTVCRSFESSTITRIISVTFKMPFTQRLTDKKIHLTIRNDGPAPTELADALSKSMKASSVGRVDSAAMGSIFTIEQPPDHERSEYFKHADWTDYGWYNGAANSIVVVSKGTESVPPIKSNASSISQLGRGHIMTLGTRGSSKPGIVDVGLFEGDALCRHRGDETSVAVTRLPGSSHMDDPTTVWHQVKEEVDASAWPWVVTTFTKV
jgi:hypothetical protein